MVRFLLANTLPGAPRRATCSTWLRARRRRRLISSRSTRSRRAAAGAAAAAHFFFAHPRPLLLITTLRAGRARRASRLSCALRGGLHWRALPCTRVRAACAPSKSRGARRGRGCWRRAAAWACCRRSRPRDWRAPWAPWRSTRCARCARGTGLSHCRWLACAACAVLQRLLPQGQSTLPPLVSKIVRTRWCGPRSRSRARVQSAHTLVLTLSYSAPYPMPTALRARADGGGALPDRNGRNRHVPRPRARRLGARACRRRALAVPRAAAQLGGHRARGRHHLRCRPSQEHALWSATGPSLSASGSPAPLMHGLCDRTRLWHTYQQGCLPPLLPRRTKRVPGRMRARRAGRPQGTAGRARPTAAPRRRVPCARSRRRARRRPVRRAEAGGGARGGPRGRGRGAERGVRRGRRVYGAAGHLPAGGGRAAHAGTRPPPRPHRAPAPALLRWRSYGCRRRRCRSAGAWSPPFLWGRSRGTSRHRPSIPQAWPCRAARAGAEPHGCHVGCQRPCEHASDTSAGCRQTTRSCRLRHCLRVTPLACFPNVGRPLLLVHRNACALLPPPPPPCYGIGPPSCTVRRAVARARGLMPAVAARAQRGAAGQQGVGDVVRELLAQGGVRGLYRRARALRPWAPLPICPCAG